MRSWRWESGTRDGVVLSFGNNRRIGVSTTTLNKTARDYRDKRRQGVLVTSVAEDGAAAKAGLKAGDIITAVDGEKVEDSGDLARGINKKKEGDVTLTVVRNKNQRNITVTPKQVSSPMAIPGTGPQAGRRVTIPRITLPTIPEINISVPRIELPVIPEINVEFPARAARACSPRQHRAVPDLRKSQVSGLKFAGPRLAKHRVRR